MDDPLSYSNTVAWVILAAWAVSTFLVLFSNRVGLGAVGWWVHGFVTALAVHAVLTLAN